MRKLVIITSVVVSTLASILLTNFLLFGAEQSTQLITVVATVEPLRLIIVDQNLTIMKILSNTTQDVRPLVIQDTTDGQELPYSDSIRKQYEFLKGALNFSKPGLLYEHEERPIQAIIKRAANTVSKWLHIGF